MKCKHRIVGIGARMLVFLCLSACSIALLSQSSQLSISSLAVSVSDSLERFSQDKSNTRYIDGPYIFRNRKENTVLKVAKKGSQTQIIEEVINSSDDYHFTCTVDNEDRDRFTFKLREKLKSPKAMYKQPEKLLAISDIEGNFNAFYSLLLSNGVINKDFDWTYGNGHLVLIGDFVDRGKNVTQVLWLIYKLEQEAERHGGVVHFILGNHEILSLEGSPNYAADKYIALAQEYFGEENKKKAYHSLMDKNRELVRWLKTKNAVEKIGNTLFVHAGISPQLINSRLSIVQINKIIRRRLMSGPSNDMHDKMDEDFLFASLGPLWYRGMAIPFRNQYVKMKESEVDRVLGYFNVKNIAIGHTIAEKVKTDYNGKVIRTDVKHALEKFAPETQGLLIENDTLYRVDGKGNKMKL